MKKMMTAALVLLASNSALAAGIAPEDAMKKFMASQYAQTEIARAKAEGLIVDKGPTAALLGGGCGFAGCSNRYLVTLATTTNYGANPQTSVISAVVTVQSFFEEARIEPKDVNSL